MARRPAPTTPESRSAQARLAAAVREYNQAVSSEQAPEWLAKLEDQLTQARTAWEAERWIALAASLPARPQGMTAEQRVRANEAIASHVC